MEIQKNLIIPLVAPFLFVSKDKKRNEASLFLGSPQLRTIWNIETITASYAGLIEYTNEGIAEEEVGVQIEHVLLRGAIPIAINIVEYKKNIPPASKVKFTILQKTYVLEPIFSLDVKKCEPISFAFRVLATLATSVVLTEVNIPTPVSVLMTFNQMFEPHASKSLSRS